MKILIPILLALFISSNASAENKYKSLKDVCGNYAHRIVLLRNILFEAEMNREEGTIATAYEDINFYAKLYHYLDCSDFRK